MSNLLLLTYTPKVELGHIFCQCGREMFLISEGNYVCSCGLSFSSK